MALTLNLQATAQTVNSAQAKSVKWQGLSGKNNEFYFLMPEGFQAFADENYFTMTKNGGKVQVDSRRVLARYTNGVVLMMELYEGDAPEIQTMLVERQKGQLIKDELVNGFQFKTFVEKTPEFVWETQYFLLKKHLYVLQAISRDENNQIARNFFESVRLVNQKQTAAPNVSNSANPNSVASPPEIVENAVERLDDSQLLQDKPDRNIIILYKPRAHYSPNARRIGLSGVVKVKVLFSSSGKVTKTEIVSSPSKDLSELASKAAEQIQFLPAEKDGKLVSTYKIIEYSFSIY
ncbi:MAG: energy transducer TonB [Pyrinomonadaceae bacterium]